MIAPPPDKAVPRVSAIMIFYDAEAFLAEAVESVLAQDFANFELLLVDDGSTDSGTAVARSFAERDPRVRYLQHPDRANHGMSATRNLGIRAARGDLIAFIDADDRWRPDKLTEQVALLERLPHVDAVGGSVNYWASHVGGKDRIVPTGHVRDRPIKPGEATLALYPLGKTHAPSMSDIIFRRDAVLRVGGFEEIFRGAYEDQAFLAKFYLSGTLFISNTVWSDYRLHEQSCMAKVGAEGTYQDQRRKFLRWFEGYLRTTSFRDDRKIRRALTRNLTEVAGSGGIRTAAKALPFAVPLVRAARDAITRLRPIIAGGPVILMYHRIANESFDPWGLAVSRGAFGDHLDWITRNRTPLSLTRFAELQTKGELPRDAIAVTFDDGYACLKEAHGLLARFRVPATVFISPALIERGREFWWDELERIVLDHEGYHLEVDGCKIYLGPARPDDRHWAPAEAAQTARQQAYREIYDLLYAMPQPVLDRAMDALREQTTVADHPREAHRPLSPNEVRELANSIIDFGSHAITHPSLPLLDARQKTSEIKGSIESCAALTGTSPTTFAYPYGNHDAESQAIVEQAGFVCACKASGSFVRSNSDRFALPRIFVGNWGVARLAQVLGRP